MKLIKNVIKNNNKNAKVIIRGTNANNNVIQNWKEMAEKCNILVIMDPSWPVIYRILLVIT